MTTDELKKEAEEYVCERNPLVTKKWFIDAFKKYDKGEKVKYLKDCEIAEYEAYLAGAEPREKRIAELEAQVEILQKKNEEYKDTLKKVRIALIQERTANIMNYGKGGVEMFDSMFEILKGVSN